MGAGRALAALSSLAATAAALPVLGGYDMVAYFSLPNTPPGASSPSGVLGSALHSLNISTVDISGGAAQPRPLGQYEFWFASAANKATFAADPWKYAPKYGGF